MDLEPAKIHAAIAEKALDRACASGSAHACCSLVKVYTDTDREKKADAARARVEAANDKSQQGRIACDVFRLGGKPKVRVIAKANAESAKALSKQEIALLEEVLSRRVPYCYAEPPKEPRRARHRARPGRRRQAGWLHGGRQRAVREPHRGEDPPRRRGAAPRPLRAQLRSGQVTPSLARKRRFTEALGLAHT